MSNKHDNYHYHKDYMIFLYIIFFIHGLLSYYFYSLSKKIEQQLEQNTKTFESDARLKKHKITKCLSTANLVRSLSIICIVLLYNKSSVDFSSFVNFLCHILPNCLFLYCLIEYVQFIINKYYEISSEQSFNFSFEILNNLYNFIIAVIVFSSVLCVVFDDYKKFIFFFKMIMSLLYLIIGGIYLFYGCKLWGKLKSYLNLESSNPLLISRIKIISLFVGITHTFRGLYDFLVSIGILRFFQEKIPLNVFDFLMFLVYELGASCVIGLTNNRVKRRTKDEISEFNLELTGERENYQKLECGEETRKK